MAVIDPADADRLDRVLDAVAFGWSRFAEEAASGRDSQAEAWAVFVFGIWAALAGLDPPGQSGWNARGVALVEGGAEMPGGLVVQLERRSPRPLTTVTTSALESADTVTGPPELPRDRGLSRANGRPRSEVGAGENAPTGSASMQAVIAPRPRLAEDGTPRRRADLRKHRNAP